jgi:hypothetical protein
MEKITDQQSRQNSSRHNTKHPDQEPNPKKRKRQQSNQNGSDEEMQLVLVARVVPVPVQISIERKTPDLSHESYFRVPDVWLDLRIDRAL